MKKKNLKAVVLAAVLSTAMTVNAAAVLAQKGVEEKKLTPAKAVEAASEQTKAKEEAAEGGGDMTEAIEHAATGAAYEPAGAVYQPSVDSEEPRDQAILMVSFGTSFNDNRKAAIGAIEEAVVEAFPDYDVRRAFTAQIIIDKLKKYDDVHVDNITEALDRAIEDGVKKLIVQPTHLMNGMEYDDVAAELAEYADQFEEIVLGEPLLTGDEDFKAVEQAITDATGEYDDGETAICYMGHGSEHEANRVYPKFQETLAADGFANYFVGTVEAQPTLEDVLAQVQNGEYKRVVLAPLMVVSGDHANNDMAGDEEGSWKKTFEAEGYEVVSLLEGLGEYEAIQQAYVEHIRKAMDGAGEKTDKVASPEEMAEKEDVVQEEMNPVYGAELHDGTYAVEVDSSSQMFQITDCELTVENGGMTAVITMGGKGYLYLYPGTGEEAANAPEEAYIPLEEDAQGNHTFRIPVEALDMGLDCAAFSKRKEKWYDRTIVFKSSSLSQEAFKNLEMTTVGDLGLADGEYRIEVKLEGGSGKSQVESPAKLSVKDGKATATIIFGSPYYDYVLVKEEKYEPVNTEGNSAFEIPVEGFDWKMPIIADTVAMSVPHEIDYTLDFDSSSIQEAEK